MKETRDQRLVIFPIEMHSREKLTTYLFRKIRAIQWIDVQTAQVFIVNSEDKFSWICQALYICVCVCV